MKSYEKLNEVTLSSVKKIVLCCDKLNNFFKVEKLSKRKRKKYNVEYAIYGIFTESIYCLEDEFLWKQDSYVKKENEIFKIFYRPHIYLEYIDGDYDQYYVGNLENIDKETEFITALYKHIHSQLSTFNTDNISWKKEFVI